MLSMLGSYYGRVVSVEMVKVISRFEVLRLLCLTGSLQHGMVMLVTQTSNGAEEEKKASKNESGGGKALGKHV